MAKKITLKQRQSAQKKYLTYMSKIRVGTEHPEFLAAVTLEKNKYSYMFSNAYSVVLTKDEPHPDIEIKAMADMPDSYKSFYTKSFEMPTKIIDSANYLLDKALDKLKDAGYKLTQTSFAPFNQRGKYFIQVGKQVYSAAMIDTCLGLIRDGNDAYEVVEYEPMKGIRIQTSVGVARILPITCKTLPSGTCGTTAEVQNTTVQTEKGGEDNG